MRRWLIMEWGEREEKQGGMNGTKLVIFKCKEDINQQHQISHQQKTNAITNIFKCQGQCGVCYKGQPTTVWLKCQQDIYLKWFLVENLKVLFLI